MKLSHEASHLIKLEYGNEKCGVAAMWRRINDFWSPNFSISKSQCWAKLGHGMSKWPVLGHLYPIKKWPPPPPFLFHSPSAATLHWSFWVTVYEMLVKLKFCHISCLEWRIETSNILKNHDHRRWQSQLLDKRTWSKYKNVPYHSRRSKSRNP